MAITGGAGRDLERSEWRLLAILGLPTFGFALATTVATTYLPVLASEFVSSTTVIGMLIAVEGIMALLLAVPAGALSDRLHTRLPFLLAGSPVLVVTLALMGFVSTLWLAIVAVVIFFAAYFIAYEPYRALYPDLVDDEIAGRGQSTQALWRGLGTIVAIGAGGLLLNVGDAVPFIAGALITSAALGVFLTLARRAQQAGRIKERPIAEELEADRATLREELGRLRGLLVERGDIRAFLVANGLWELSLGALKTFIILYLTRGLHVSTSTGALAVTGGAVFVGIAAPVSGKLADRFGSVRVMRLALLVYGIGLLVPFFFTDKIVVGAAAPIICFGGGVVMTLPYALLIPLMDADDHGLSTGLYSLSRGIGTALGPLLAGIAIGIFHGTFSSTQGYQAVWLICATAILASVPVLGLLKDRHDG